MVKPPASSIHERRFTTRLKPFTGRPDLTPMVDVFFILLLFFLLSSSFIQISGVKVELPQAASGYSSVGMDWQMITVAWAEEGSLIYFNDKPVTLDTLKAELARLSLARPNARIILYADYRVPSGDTLKITTLAQRANLPVIFATMPENDADQAVFQ